MHGCIDHLSSAHKLVKLDLASTAVTGEFLHLMACHDLQMVPWADQRDTDVSQNGDVSMSSYVKKKYFRRFS